MRNYLVKRNENNIFDAFDDLFRPIFCNETHALRTDIRENEKDYTLDIEVPGFTKEQIKVSLEDGYLTVSCDKQEKEETNEKYLRREIASSYKRSYFVGHDVAKEDIKAKYYNGILTLVIPKESPKTAQSTFITIE